MGITMSELYPTKKEKKLELVAKYQYMDEDGNLLFEKLRYLDENGKKEFRQRKPDGKGGWEYKLGDTPRVLYNLPMVLKAKLNGDPIWVVEGEKDANSLIKLGICATTMPNGAGTWLPIHTDVLAGAVVEVIADNDDAGIKHAKSVYEELSDAGCDVQVWSCTKGKDITDHLSSGGKIEELVQADLGVTENPRDETPVEKNAVSETHEGRAINELFDLFERADMSENQKLARAQLIISRNASTKIVDTGRLVSWSDFVSETDDDSYDWVIPGLLERNERVIVVAAEGVGKTMLARQVAICVGMGIHPFTYQPIKPQVTLSIDLENPERIIRRTSRSIYAAAQAVSKNQNPQAHLLIKPQGFDLLRMEDRAVLEEMLEKTRPAILMMGPLYKSFIDPGGRTSEAVAIEVARYLDTIRDVYQCAMWLEHHAPLGTSMTTRDLRPFGSAVWSRWPEFGVSLQPDPTGMPFHYDVRHFRGARDERQWPVRIKRGKRFPFEVVDWPSSAKI
jgi:5S rRNA maturation endonuclease (ribonuclease M5)